MPTAIRRVFWARTKRLTLLLLGAWLLVNLLVPWFARDLDGVHVLGFPLSFWLASEGTLLIYLLLIVVYVVAMNRLERGYLDQSLEQPVDQASAAPPAVRNEA
jgi:putative solute:sodium symporter small subunit